MIVYGANIKPLTGELIVTHTRFNISDYNWYRSDSGLHPFFYRNPTDIKRGGSCICESYKSIDSVTAFSFGNNAPNYSLCVGATAEQIYIRNDDYTDPTEFKNAHDGVYIVYELATPVTYQLTPTEVRSLLGINNIWADCGSITELKYIRDLNLCINDIIARIEALEGGSNTRGLSVSSVLTKSIVSDSDTAEGKTEETEEETKEEAQKNER